MTKYRAAAYLCGEKDQRKAQKKQLQRYAKKYSIRIARYYEDWPVFIEDRESWMSDIDTCSLGGLCDLLEDVEHARYKYILVTHKDFLKRESRPGICHVSMDAEHELRHETVEVCDLKDAEVHNVTLMMRLAIGRRNGAQLGYTQSGPVPYGYRSGRCIESGRKLIVSVQRHAEIVQFIFHEYLRLKSLRLLSILMKELGIKTQRGAQWSRAGLAWVLKNKVYVGIVCYAGIESKGHHQGLVSHQKFDRVQVLLRKNNKGGRVKLCTV